MLEPYHATKAGQTTVTLRLTRHLTPSMDAATSKSAGNNIAFSPASMYAALALVAKGASGTTLTQLLDFLGARSDMALDIFGYVLSDFILAGHRPGSEGPCLLFGGGVWGDASYGELTKGFCDIAAAEPYMFAAKTVSFAKEGEATVNAINERVKNATKNLVNGIISTGDIGAATGVVLADAASFVGKWLEPFVHSSTSQGSFHLLDGSNAEAMFMRKLTVVQVACMDGFKVLRLPYTPGSAKMRQLDYIADTQYSMLVFLPDARDGIAGMVAALPAKAPAFLRGVPADMTERPVDLKLPRFEISFAWDGLEGDLRKLGLTLPFSPEEADLRRMFGGGDGVGDGGLRRPVLSKVVHKTFIGVNEAGTGVATAMPSKDRGGARQSPDIVEFFADHPFTFFIVEEIYRAVVFAGHVLDPTK